jgi:ATP synthase protein I
LTFACGVCLNARHTRSVGLPMALPNDPLSAGFGQAIRIATELLAALLVGGGLGWAADTYLFGSSPWGVVIGLVIGVAAGIRNAMRAAERWS